MVETPTPPPKTARSWHVRPPPPGDATSEAAPPAGESEPQAAGAGDQAKANRWPRASNAATPRLPPSDTVPDAGLMITLERSWSTVIAGASAAQVWPSASATVSEGVYTPTSPNVWVAPAEEATDPSPNAQAQTRGLSPPPTLAARAKLVTPSMPAVLSAEAPQVSSETWPTTRTSSREGPPGRPP